MPRRQTSRRGAKEINSVSNDEGEHPRTLAGATVLQIVPALREEPAARTALNVAAALREIGARALVAAEDGPLVAELTGSGGEWVPLVNATVNPFQLRRGAQSLQRLIASERIDIVHAQSAGGAWIANMAAAHTSVLLVIGRVAPWNGQLIVPEIARIMLDGGMRGFVFVLAGEHRSHRKYARAVMEQAQNEGVRPLVRQTGHCRDMPAALAAADTVVVPAIEPPALGRLVAQAQSMA